MKQRNDKKNKEKDKKMDGWMETQKGCIVQMCLRNCLVSQENKWGVTIYR